MNTEMKNTMRQEALLGCVPVSAEILTQPPKFDMKFKCFYRNNNCYPDAV